MDRCNQPTATAQRSKFRQHMTLLGNDTCESVLLADFQLQLRRAALDSHIRKIVHAGPDMDTEIDMVAEKRALFAEKIARGPRSGRQFPIKRKLRFLLLRARYAVQAKIVIVSFLLLLGTVTGVVGFLMDVIVNELRELHWLLYNATDSWGVQFLLWTTYIVVGCLAACLLTRIMSPLSVGSGIPEMKCILSGVELPQYLTFRVLVCKMLGLSMALGSGMLIGKEGPFVHYACVVAAQILRLPLYSRIRNCDSLRKQMLAAGAAVGVSANFGTPIGGVLFSIEVTSTYYPVRNYWKAFVGSIAGALVFIVGNAVAGGRSDNFTALFHTDFKELRYNGVELFYFALLGMFCGFLGAMFTQLNAFFIRFRARHHPIWALTCQLPFVGWRFPFFFPLGMALLTGLLTFPKLWGEFAGLGGSANIDDVFEAGDVRRENGWYKNGLLFSLFYMWIMRFFLCAASITIPAPAGMYAPLLTIGAVLGRTAGELVRRWQPVGGWLFNDAIFPAGYAVVGAAAFCGGCTHTISSAVIVLEVTGQLNHALPVLVGVIMALGVSSLISRSIYDSILNVRGLPYRPWIEAEDRLKRTVGEYMLKDVAFLTPTSNYLDVERILVRYPNQSSYPVVESVSDRLLLCSVLNPMLVALHAAFLREHGLPTLQALARQHSTHLRKVIEIEELSDPVPNCLLLRGAASSADSSDSARESSERSFRSRLHSESGDSQPLQLEVELDGKDGSSKSSSLYSGGVGGSARLRRSRSLSSLSLSSASNVQSSWESQQGSSSWTSSSVEIVLPDDVPEASAAVSELASAAGSFSAAAAASHSSSVSHSDTAAAPAADSGADSGADGEDHFAHELSDDFVRAKAEREEVLRAHVVSFCSCSGVVLDTFPLLLVENAPMVYVQFLFTWLRMREAYITSLGRLAGVITRREVDASLRDTWPAFMARDKARLEKKLARKARRSS